MKVPQAWSKGGPVSLTAFQLDASGLVPQPGARIVSTIGKTPTKIEARGDNVIEQPGTELTAEGDIARWWQEMSDASKAEYVAEHPNSKYADMHRKEKVDVKPGEKPAHDAKPAPAPAPEPR